MQAGRGVARGGKVTSVTTGASVESISEWVEKLQTVPRVPGLQYLKVGIDNYLLWAMYDSGSSHTLPSTGLCKELGLAIDTTQPSGSYRLADGSLRNWRAVWNRKFCTLLSPLRTSLPSSPRNRSSSLARIRCRIRAASTSGALVYAPRRGALRRCS